jgi:hypothetical protein
VSNMPPPGSERAKESELLAAAELAEVVRLYGLRALHDAEAILEGVLRDAPARGAKSAA